jgi:acyl-CoA-binding protein
LDRDVNGLISHDEVQSQPSLVRLMNLYYQDSFLEADVNKDGVLDREELYAYEEEISAE